MPAEANVTTGAFESRQSSACMASSCALSRLTHLPDWKISRLNGIDLHSQVVEAAGYTLDYSCTSTMMCCTARDSDMKT